MNEPRVTANVTIPKGSKIEDLEIDDLHLETVSMAPAPAHQLLGELLSLRRRCARLQARCKKLSSENRKLKKKGR